MDPHLKMYFGRRRACGEIWVEAETLGRLSSPGVTMVVLAITANARPVVQRFSSIITLMMDVTEVSLLRQLAAAAEVRVFLSDGAI